MGYKHKSDGHTQHRRTLVSRREAMYKPYLVVKTYEILKHSLLRGDVTEHFEQRSENTK